VREVARFSFRTELVVAVLLTLRFWVGYDRSLGRSVYEGIFHAVSSYNNAGFALYSNNLIGFATDPFVCLPIAAAIVIGGLGIPVLLELRRGLRTPRTWSVHTKIALLGYGLLLLAGWAAFDGFEWRKPGDGRAARRAGAFARRA